MYLGKRNLQLGFDDFFLILMLVKIFNDRKTKFFILDRFIPALKIAKSAAFMESVVGNITI